MSFEILPIEYRVPRMVTWIAGIQSDLTDFLPGSKIRTKLEAVAVELEAQDLAFWQAMKKAIPVSIYNAFSFDRLPAVSAAGEVTFTCLVAPTATITIPLGTQVSTTPTVSDPERVYATTEVVTIAPGNLTAAAPVACTVAGVRGNVVAAAVNKLKTSIPGVDTVSNASAFTGGADAESEAARRLRFVAFVSSMARSTKSGVEYGAMTAQLSDAQGNLTERVVEAHALDPEAPPYGEAKVWIYNGAGYSAAGGATTELVAKAQQIVDGYEDTDGTLIAGYKAAGVVVTVAAAATLQVDVSGTITVTPGSSKTLVKTLADAVVAEYLSSLVIGQSALRSEIIGRLMNLDGVANVVLAAPVSDQAAALSYATSEVLVAGSFSGLTVP